MLEIFHSRSFLLFEFKRTHVSLSCKWNFNEIIIVNDDKKFIIIHKNKSRNLYILLMFRSMYRTLLIIVIKHIRDFLVLEIGVLIWISLFQILK